MSSSSTLSGNSGLGGDTPPRQELHTKEPAAKAGKHTYDTRYWYRCESLECRGENFVHLRLLFSPILSLKSNETVPKMPHAFECDGFGLARRRDERRPCQEAAKGRHRWDFQACSLQSKRVALDKDSKTLPEPKNNSLLITDCLPELGAFYTTDISVHFCIYHGDMVIICFSQAPTRYCIRVQGFISKIEQYSNMALNVNYKK